jgi:hypothetical protein
MEYFALWLSNLTGFLMLVTGYVALLYLLIVGFILGRCVVKERVFGLTPQLGVLVGAALVYLLSCATWFWGLQ